MVLISAASLTFLLINGLLDILKRRISVIAALTFFVGGIIYSIIYRHAPFFEVLLALLPGVLLILLSVISEGGVGMGDGIVILLLGFYLDAATLITGLSISFLASAFFAMVLYLKKRNHSYSFPFIPFVFIGYASILATQLFA